MPERINQSQPSQIEQLRRAYHALGPQLQAVQGQFPTAPAVGSALARFEQRRVDVGSGPLGQEERARALAAGLTEDQITPAPVPSLATTARNILNPIGGRENPLINDLALIGQSIPHLPKSLIEEVGRLGDLPGGIEQALAEGTNPLQDLGNLASLPGLRFIPGAYVAANLGQGQDVTDPSSVEGSPGELLRHPLFTALDVLPIAQGAARLTPQVRGVEEALRTSGKLPEGARVRRPLSELALRRADPDVASGVRPTAVGRGLTSGWERFGKTKPGAIAQDLWDGQIRELSKTAAQSNVRLQDRLDPEQLPRYADEEMAGYARGTNMLPERYTVEGSPEFIAPERRREIDLGIQERGKTQMLQDATDLERQYITDIERYSSMGGQVGVRTGELGQVPYQWGDEIYDAPTAKKILNQRKKRDVVTDVANYRAAASGFTDDLVPDVVVREMDDVLQQSRFKPTEKARLVEARAYALARMGIDTKPLIEAITKFRSKKNTAGIDVVETAVRDLDFTKMLDEGSSINIQRFLNRTKQYEPKLVEKFTKKAERTESLAVPARFRPMVADEVRTRIKRHIESNPDMIEIPIEEAMRLADEGNFGLIRGLEKTDYRAIQRDVMRTWRELADMGLDPVYIHRVNPSQVSALNYPNVYERIDTPSQVRKAMNDMTPAFDDAIVAVRHQAFEWVKRQTQEELAAQYIKDYGVDELAAREEFLPRARAAHATDPRLSVEAHLERFIRNEYQEFNPSSFITWKSPRMSVFPEKILLPKKIFRNVERMHDTASGPITSVTDPVMKVFRTSLLPLSPRWHLYNLIGGQVMLMARTSPMVLKYTKEAMDMVRENRLPPEIPRGFGTVSREVVEFDQRPSPAALRRWDKQASLQDRVAAGWSFKGGQKLREWWDSLGPVRDAGGKLVDRSYQFNGFVDDTYRAMALLYGQNKALRKGMTRQAAFDEGVSLVRRTMQNWDEMTPLERSILRSVFPFYGWMSHILRYTMSYPFDHPIRAQVTAQFARNELEDRGAGLGDRFLNLFYIGEPDENGMVRSINTSGMNPFSDVANYFSLAGFTGNVNPIIGGVLQSLGVDTSSGAAGLYPNMRFDTETGRLVADNGNIFTNILQSTIPQTRLLFQLSGQSAEFQELLRRNPEAARRMMLSQIGVPMVVRDVPIYEERFKAELARMDAESRAESQALRTGDWSEAQTYPGLQPYLEQIRALQGEGGLEPFQPTEPTPSVLDLLNPLG